MKKFLLIVLFSFILSASAQAEDKLGNQESDFFSFGDFKVKKAPHNEQLDSLNFDTEIKPLTKEMSTEEKSVLNSEFENVYKPEKTQEITCDLPQLKKQIKSFVFNHMTDNSESSVIKRRQQILAIRNIHDFADVTDEKIDSKKDFLTASAVAYLKINENRTISRICKSSDNANEKLNGLYAVIYPYADYYKVVIPNLMTSAENIDDATFIFNW